MLAILKEQLLIKKKGKSIIWRVCCPMALKMFNGPSALNAVEGRIEQVSTTGFFDLITRFRKYAVSSIVSVP